MFWNVLKRAFIKLLLEAFLKMENRIILKELFLQQILKTSKIYKQVDLKIT